MTKPWVLGISCSHNGSACLLHGDEIVAAVQDERLLRIKRRAINPRFARYSIEYCLNAAGIRPDSLDMVVYCVTRGVDEGINNDIFVNERLRLGASGVRVESVPHHYAHAVSVFATSGFTDSAILVVDGSGTAYKHLPCNEKHVVIDDGVLDDDLEWLSYYEASGTDVVPVRKQMARAHGFDNDGLARFGSIGDMYGAVGQHIFGSFFDGPGKVMGLAPYGCPVGAVEDWVTMTDRGVCEFSPVGYKRGATCRWPDDFAGCANLAASVQRATESALLEIVERIRADSSSVNLCYAGGVALNSVANEAIVRRGGFDDVFIFPAAEDSGVAVGAAYHGLWRLMGRNTCRRLLSDALGRSYTAEDVERAIVEAPAIMRTRTTDLSGETAALLAAGKIVAWFRGRSELGPRSLGQRTILCDPRRPDGKEWLNSRIKHRESFRPYAPVIMREYVTEWFDVPPRGADSPFMLRVWTFRGDKATVVPAVAHVDGTARVQTITKDSHPVLYDVLKQFYATTGVPMLLNTSLNVAGEPIAESPEDALWCLLSTELDYCIMGDDIVSKAAGHQSILSLYPRVVAKALTIKCPVRGGHVSVGVDTPEVVESRRRLWGPASYESVAALQARVDPQGAHDLSSAWALTDTRWGESVVLLSREHLRCLASIDGSRSGHSMVTDGGWTEPCLAEILADLHRASLVKFSAA